MSEPRVLLQRLRQVMAGPAKGEARLEGIVRVIAANMVAEVSSLYIVRRDGSLELFATQGLQQSAVHNTHLKPGEGLVGLIADRAQPMKLAEAQSHPAFSYRPETGEETYHSFLGVPILHGGRTLGVLTVQNARPRLYSEEEVEVLQTVAMVLAEIIASGAIEGLSPVETDPQRSQSLSLSGTALSPGVALGHVVFHEPQVKIGRLLSDDITYERQRLDQALVELRQTIDAMLERGDVPGTGEHRDVLEAYRMFAHDEGWQRRLREAVAAGLSAEAAVARVQNDMRARMLRHTDPFWRERLHDLDDLANRLLRILTGRTGTAASEELSKDTVLVARMMGASELLDYNPKSLRGLLLEEGGLSSHVAIVARALNIPALGTVDNLLMHVHAGDPIVVDAFEGRVHLRPSLDLIRSYADKVRFQAKRQAQFSRLRLLPAQTFDNQRVRLNMNAGLLVDVDHVVQSGADGIGLFRTELQFMISSTFPRLQAQTRMYREIMDAACGRPVVFRTLDIGGDKILPYLRHGQESNPALGWRAIRIALDRPALLRTQMRALMRACAGRELRVMVPFVSEIEEFQAARAMLDKELAHARRHNHPEPTRIMLGAMIEVPAILWELDELLPMTDFVSVGSNDLLQFLFATDRTNPHVADRFDPLSCPPLRVLRQIVEAASRHKVPINLCGEMAGRPLEAMALVALGFRSLSMSAASIGPVKAMVRALDTRQVQAYLSGILAQGSHDIRNQLTAFAKANNIPVC